MPTLRCPPRVAGGLFWAVFLCFTWQCQAHSLSPQDGAAQQVQELTDMAGAGIGEVQGQHFEEVKASSKQDPLKGWRGVSPEVPRPKVSRAASLQNGIPEQKGESEQDAAQGYHHIPGLTIDSPAITKMENATLQECVKACSQVHLCTGVQYSQDLKLEGGNCLIMERRVQFSQTFDYYERPGVSEEQVKQMDQEMMNKWTDKDIKESDPDPQDLGGLSAADIPGSTYVDTRKSAKEFAAEEALERASEAIAGINHNRETEKQQRIVELESGLKEEEKTYAASKLQLDELSSKTIQSGAKAMRLAKEYEDTQVKGAKLKLRVSEFAKKSQAAIKALSEAQSKAEEYLKAGKAYHMAGNPMAKKMEEKFKKWQGILSARKLALLDARKQRLDLQAQADAVLTKGRELEQDAEWAKVDHQDLVKREHAAQQLKQLAFKAQEEMKKRLKDVSPMMHATMPPPSQAFRMSNSVVTQLRDA